MKKLSVIVLLCLCLTGCGKEQLTPPDVSEFLVDSVVSKVNGYQFITDSEMQENAEQYGFNPEAWQEPDYFYINEVKVIPANNMDEFLITLEDLNRTVTLDTTGLENIMYPQGNTYESFKTAIKNREGNCEFYFRNPDVESNMLRFILETDEENKTEVTLDFIGTGVEDAENKGIILCYDDKQLNIIKQSSAGINRMTFGKFDGVPKYVSATVSNPDAAVPVPIENYEFDMALKDIIDIPENGVIEGVTCVQGSTAYLHASEMTNAHIALGYLAQLSHNMIVFLENTETEKQTFTSMDSSTLLDDILSAKGEVIMEFYDYTSQNCRLTAVVTDSEMTITAHPSDEEAIMSTIRVYYDSDVPYVPYDYTHVMKVTFKE